MRLNLKVCRHVALLVLTIPYASVMTASATTIAPQGSLTLALKNFASGSPYYSQPYFVYSSNGGSAPTFDSSSNTWSGGTSGQMTASTAAPQNVAPAAATVSIQGQRYVFQTGPLSGVYNLGINIGDIQTLISGGKYPDGNYAASANLIVALDGLKFEFNQVTATYITAGSAAFQNDDFTGQMDAGTNTSTGQRYYQGVANLDLSLNQSYVAGDSTIGYTVTLNVQPMPASEPPMLAVLGVGVVALGVLRHGVKGR